MKLKILLACFLIWNGSAHAQLFIGTNAQLSMMGDAKLTLQNSSLVNHGIFLPGGGTVCFTGNDISSISGSQNTLFNNVQIDKTGNSLLRLQRPVQVAGSAVFVSGNIDLNGFDLNLGNTGTLSGEKESSRITGSNGGQVLFSTVLNNPVNANPANLGAMITCGQNMGTVLIRRGHQAQVNSYGTGSSVLRYYDIIPTSNSNLNATLRFYYFDGELNGINENTLVFWSSTDNLHWKNEDFTLGNTNLNYMEKAGIASFSRWTLSNSNNPLPVKFTSFNTRCNGSRILLTWKTAQEQNSSHFNVERNINGINWSVIGHVPAAGNSNTESSYSFTDSTPAEKSFYRLAQYDRDGKVTYTNILMSSCSNAGEIRIGPNPFRDKLVLNIQAQDRSVLIIKMFDSKGALIKQQNVALRSGMNQEVIYTKELPRGLYILVADSGKEEKVVRVIKQ